MQQSSGNAYNYCVKLLLGLIGVFPDFFFQYLHESKYRVTNNFEGTG